MANLLIYCYRVALFSFLNSVFSYIWCKIRGLDIYLYAFLLLIPPEAGLRNRTASYRLRRLACSRLVSGQARNPGRSVNMFGGMRHALVLHKTTLTAFSHPPFSGLALLGPESSDLVVHYLRPDVPFTK